MYVKTLVAYYSHSGDTRKIAKLIRQKTDGRIFEIEPETPYPEGYDDVLAQARAEMEKNIRPPLKALPDNLDFYDTVFVGSPNWWSRVAPPVAAFLAGCDLSRKTVIPFYTHGGGGAGEIEEDIATLCPGATIRKGFVMPGNSGVRAEELVDAWLRDNGIVG